jgi:hypothetical protein
VAAPPEPFITIDVDWAPDFMIEAMADRLISAGVCATWLITHSSPALQRLRNHPHLFELGIHPNFQAGSTHGATPEEVIDQCLDLVPEAKTVRTHGLVQSSNLLGLLATRGGIQTDLSIFLPHLPSVHPTPFRWQNWEILRIPYVWEDDCEMSEPVAQWHGPDLAEEGRGPRIINLHPALVYLNWDSLAGYHEMRRRSGGNIGGLTVNAVQDLVRPASQAGPAFTFNSLVDHLSRRGGGRRICDLAAELAGDRQSSVQTA